MASVETKVLDLQPVINVVQTSFGESELQHILT